MIATICSSVKRAFRIAPYESGASLSRNQWFEILEAGQWIHEIKHDGHRLIARRHGDRVRSFTGRRRLDRALSADPRGDGRPGAGRDN